jgi:hypothetical protein
MRNTLIRIRQGFVSSPSAVVAGILGCAGIAIYVLWYASAGNFPTLVPIDNAYIDLGEAFLHGQLSLLENPSPQLLALENPYDPATRIAPYLWDASFYEGQYYLYWGPVPALAFAVVEGITHSRPPGSLLIVICYIGLPIILTMILYQLRRYFFPQAPGLSIGLCILMGFMNLPFLFLLGRSAIYETSVIAGQFFLCLGLLGWVMYVTGAGKARWLIMTGLNWGLAIGSRYNLVVSVIIYLIFALTQIVQDVKGRQMQRRVASLLIPLTLCIIGLGIYNFARFGNLLETGMKYQLSIPQDQNGFYSPSYIPSNLFIYLFYPITTARSFPFIISTLPLSGRFDEIVAGLVPSTPGIWLSALAIPYLILTRRSTNTFQDNPARRSWKPFLAMIMVAVLIQFLFLTTLFYAAMRYMSDFYLQLTLGIWILVWWVDEYIRAVVWLRATFWLIVTGLVFWTVGIGFFGSFDIPPQTFRVSNPGLYMQIASYWDHWFKALGIFKVY